MVNTNIKGLPFYYQQHGQDEYSLRDYEDGSIIFDSTNPDDYWYEGMYNYYGSVFYTWIDIHWGERAHRCLKWVA